MVALSIPTATLQGIDSSASSHPLLFALAWVATVLLTWILAIRRSRRGERRRVAAERAAADANQNAAWRTANEQAARVQAIVAAATEGIVTINQQGVIETVNTAAERLFGYRAEELRGRNVSLLMPSPFREEHDGYIQRYLRTGQARIIGIGREVLGMRRDGSTFPIDLSVGEGFVDGVRFFTAIVRDVTERKEMQAKLAQTERLAAVGELAAGVAHEVNNPINTIINCAQLIKDGDDTTANCDIILDEGERIATIVRDLLQFARDDRDRPQATAIAEVVTRSLRLVGENFKRHGIRLTIGGVDDVPQVKARPQQLQQVLLNLLFNAKDALLADPREAREVWIEAQCAGDGVALVVRDNGPGIPPHLGNRIFEPFVTTKRAKGGTGLGLSISKGIVEGYGGTIDASSAPGQGASFRVWLPRFVESHDEHVRQHAVAED